MRRVGIYIGISAMLIFAGKGRGDTTYVAGAVTGLWNPAGSPYITIGDIYVPRDGSLEIQARVSVILNDMFHIYGEFHANGIEGDSVYISGNYNHFHVEYPSGVEVSFDYCKITQSSLHLYGEGIVINRSEVNYSGLALIGYLIECVGGVVISNSELIVDIFHGASVVGWAIYGGDGMLVVNNNIYVNTWSGGDPATSYGVYSSSGYFIGNYIWVRNYSSIVPQFSQSIGFKQCEGYFSHNLIKVEKFGNTGESYGFSFCDGVIENNTLVFCGSNIYGVRYCTGDVKNNILHTESGFPTLGILGGTVAHIYNIYSNTTPGVTLGTGEFIGDPIFAGNYALSSASPCIDTGDPNSPLDHDSTCADLGCYYYPQQFRSPYIYDIPDTINNMVSGFQEMSYFGHPEPEWEITIKPSWLNFIEEYPVLFWEENIPPGDTILQVQGENPQGITLQSFPIFVLSDSVVDDLTITIQGNDIFLDWSDVIGATQYRIYRGASAYFNITGINPLAIINSTQFTDIDVISCNRYFYLVTWE